ncbi:hypothetical protein CVT24_008639, partial [Panaeolus cyanescens]
GDNASRAATGGSRDDDLRSVSSGRYSEARSDRIERQSSYASDRRTPYDDDYADGRRSDYDRHASGRGHHVGSESRRSGSNRDARSHLAEDANSDGPNRRDRAGDADRRNRDDGRRDSDNVERLSKGSGRGGDGGRKGSSRMEQDDERRRISEAAYNERRPRKAEDARAEDHRRSGGNRPPIDSAQNKSRAKEGMFSTANDAREANSRFLSGEHRSRELSRASTDGNAHRNRNKSPVKGRSRNASPVRAGRGQSVESQRGNDRGKAAEPRPSRSDQSGPTKGKGRQDSASEKHKASSGSKGSSAASGNHVFSPDWAPATDLPVIFDMDIDTQEDASGAPAEGGSVDEKTKDKTDAGNEAAGEAPGPAEGSASKASEAELQLDDYDDDDLPTLEFCEMRASFTKDSQSFSNPYFLDLRLIAEDLQIDEMRMIESAHIFKQSVPFANFARMEPGAFDLDSPQYRLVWNANWVAGTEPAMSSAKPRNAVGIQLGIVRRPNLKKAVSLSSNKTYMSRRLGILPTEMALKRMVRLMGTKLGWPALKLSIDEGSIVNYSVKGASGNTPSKSRYTRAAVSKTTDPSGKEKANISAGFFPSVLEFSSTVKVYDARNTGFRFDKEHLSKLEELPEYTTFTEDSELNMRCLVAVGFTLNAYGVPKDQPVDEESKECPTISSNIQFAILLAVLPFDM